MGALETDEQGLIQSDSVNHKRRGLFNVFSGPMTLFKALLQACPLSDDSWGFLLLGRLWVFESIFFSGSSGAYGVCNSGGF